MSFSLFFVLALLGSSALTQAFYIPESKDIDLFQYKSLAESVSLDNPECFQSLVSGFYVVREAWILRGQWMAIQQERENGLAHCNNLPNLLERKDCIAAIEKGVQQAKSHCYRSGFGLSFAAVVIGMKAKATCFDEQI